MPTTQRNPAFDPSSPFYVAMLGASDDPAQQGTVPGPTPDRIADDQTAGKRGVTPQSPSTAAPSAGFTGSRYDTANMHPYGPQYPLEQRVSQEQAEYKRMTTPPPPASFKERLLRGLGGFALGAAMGPRGVQEELTRRDQDKARQQQERENLAGRISTDTRQLASEGVQEQGQDLRARLAAQAQVAAAQRLGETLSQRTSSNQNTVAGANTRAAATVGQQQAALGEKAREFNVAQANKLDVFHQSQDYLKWKTQFDDANKLRIAQMQQGKAPAAMFQTAEFASSGLNRLSSAQQAMQRLDQSGVMGQSWAQNKLEDWLFGAGAVDPRLTPQQRSDIGQLRAALTYTSSAAMRAHTGRTSREIYDDFKQTMGPGQDWDALKGAMQETGSMLNDYATSASDANIRNLRGGGAPSPSFSERTRQQTPPRPPGVPPDAKWDPDSRTWYGGQ